MASSMARLSACRAGGVEVRDEGHTQMASGLQMMVGKPMEVAHQGSDGAGGVLLVDVGMHILHVDAWTTTASSGVLVLWLQRYDNL